MFTGHTLVLQNTFGRDVCTRRAVSPNNVLKEFDSLCVRAERFACPIIFMDGYGYTSRPEFMRMLQERNRVSLEAGGSVLFDYPGAVGAALAKLDLA